MIARRAPSLADLRPVGMTSRAGVRGTNQDFAAATSLALAVADGMGGLEAGDVAARLAVTNALHVIEKLLPARRRGRRADRHSAGLADCVADAVGVANEAVAKLSEGISAQAGSTLALAVPYGRTLRGDLEVWLAHVGDSLAVAVDRGEVRLLTTPHTLAREAIDAGGRFLRGEHNVLARRLGTDLCRPDVAYVRVRRGSRILLLTDGVANVLTAEDVLAVAGLAPVQAAAALVNEAIRLGSRDDCTAAVFDWGPSRAPRGGRHRRTGSDVLSALPVSARMLPVGARADRSVPGRTQPLPFDALGAQPYRSLPRLWRSAR